MSIVVFQHHQEEGPAELGRILQNHGHRLRTVRFDRSQTVPADLDEVDGLIIMGGAMNVDEVTRYPWLNDEMAYIRQVHQAGKPVVGICLGAQLIAAALGGEVAAMEKPEVGWAPLNLAFPGTIDPLYAGISWKSMQFHLHGQQVTKLPPGATPLAGSAACRTQAFKVGFRTYAFQYHFEWSRSCLQTVAHDDLVKRAGVEPRTILDAIGAHYGEYRRLGDRLCDTIATVLMPFDKRQR